MTTRTWSAGVLLVWLAGCGDASTLDGGVPYDAPRAPDAGRDAGRDAGTARDGGRDAGFDAALDAGSDAGTTTDSGLGSTPGPGDLVIVGIQGNPQGALDTEAEYIELLNVSGRMLDLEGMRLTHLAWTGGEPVNSLGMHTVASSVLVAPGARVLLARSSGDFFGGATRDYVYDGFEFSNGGTFQNRIRLMVPSWDGTEPPPAADVIDEVKTAVGVFDNLLRGRTIQLDPARVPSPSAASNDNPANFCQTATDASLEYRTGNWGTPRADNRCM